MSYAVDLTVKALRNDGLNEQKVIEVLQALSKELAEMPIMERMFDGKIKSVLAQINMPTHLKGYVYWIEAIHICKKNGKRKMMQLYQEIAEIHQSKAKRVERDMRYSKMIVFKSCSLQTIKEFFGKVVFEDDIKNIEFLSVLLEKI